MRLVKSLPEIGMMLKVGFSEALAPQLKLKKLVPLGSSMASQIGINPRVAAIVVGIGVSNSFLLPTHQVNALYMGPGDYRTKDYMRIGGVLSLIYVSVLVIMTYLFYL